MKGLFKRKQPSPQHSPQSVEISSPQLISSTSAFVSTAEQNQLQPVRPPPLFRSKTSQQQTKTRPTLEVQVDIKPIESPRSAPAVVNQRKDTRNFSRTEDCVAAELTQHIESDVSTLPPLPIIPIPIPSAYRDPSPPLLPAQSSSSLSPAFNTDGRFSSVENSDVSPLPSRPSSPVRSGLTRSATSTTTSSTRSLSAGFSLSKLASAKKSPTPSLLSSGSSIHTLGGGLKSKKSKFKRQAPPHKKPMEFFGTIIDSSTPYSTVATGDNKGSGEGLNGITKSRSIIGLGLLNGMTPIENGRSEGVKEEDGTGVAKFDEGLKDWAWYFKSRYSHFQQTLARISSVDGALPNCEPGLENFVRSYEYMGFQVDSSTKTITFTEYIPTQNSVEDDITVCLVGRFNNWSCRANPMCHIGDNIWQCVVPPLNNDLGIPIGGEVKIQITTIDRVSGEESSVWRNPSYTLLTTQSPGQNDFKAKFIPLPKRYEGKRPSLNGKTLRIYEAHIGCATTLTNTIGTFEQFEREVLVQRVHKGGYNVLQIIGVVEHPYYASFGYQVSSLFAPSSRFGTTAQLISLVDAAHRLGIKVILDVVHSHACSNEVEGLRDWTGEEDSLGSGGWFKEGRHPTWGTCLFDYSSTHVLRLLLSNLHYIVDRLGFDGFRFDSVSSMIYKSHSIDMDYFNGGYGVYFNEDTDHEGVEYLMLANHMLHTMFSFEVTTIAEDFSGFPTLALPVSTGGVGFDYRLGLGVPHLWFSLLRESQEDESDWSVQRIVSSLGLRRLGQGEKSIGFVESHDECIDNKKTSSQWLFDSDIYDGMSRDKPATERVARAMALHKLMRLITMSYAGEGYMNFMGNEFGHPEWLNLPGVHNSFKSVHARRQWRLADDRHLRFYELGKFDRILNRIEEKGGFGSGNFAHVFIQDEKTRLLIYSRSSHLFIINLHPTATYEPSEFPVPDVWAGSGRFITLLHTDLDQVGKEVEYINELYLPPRSGIVIARFGESKKSTPHIPQTKQLRPLR